jgi:glycosyltransferase involved in cell wall biosynthesis
MLNSSPLVTVGMPVLNCERTVALAVASILNQHYETWELIVVDDGSQDQTVKTLRAFRDDRLRVVVDGYHRGIAVRRNQLIDLARGEYLAWIDADDVAYPERLHRQVSHLAQNPGVDLLGASMIMFRNDGVPFAFWKTGTVHASICGPPWASMRLAQPTWMGRIAWFRRHRYCDDIVSGAEDRELLSRSSPSSRFAGLPEVLVGYCENGLRLSKWLPRRRDAIKFLFRDQVKHRRYCNAGLVVGAEIAKGMLDVIAMSTPLGYAIVPYRSSKVPAALMKEWYEVWEKCCSSAQGYRLACVRPTGRWITW